MSSINYAATILMPVFMREDYLNMHLEQLTKQKNISNYEIIVLNDGVVDSTENICNSFDKLLHIKYVFTGIRNTASVDSRMPGYCLNIGAKKASGNILILTCPEMYLLESDIIDTMTITSTKNIKNVVITHGKYDNGLFKQHLLEHDNVSKEIYDSIKTLGLCTIYPFYLALSKNEFINIGGYDEDFIGTAWDDTDFSRRLHNDNCVFIMLNKHVIHLKHSKCKVDRVKWLYNKKLFEKRDGIVIRNTSKRWGI